MKRALMALAVLLAFSTSARADVTSNVIETVLTKDGEVEVHSQMQIDGVTAPNPDGKPYWIVRYNVIDFAGLSKDQISARVQSDFTNIGQTLLKRKYISVATPAMDVSFLIGQTFDLPSADIIVDSGSTGKSNTVWTVKTDGSRTEAPYTAPAPTVGS